MKVTRRTRRSSLRFSLASRCALVSPGLGGSDPSVITLAVVVAPTDAVPSLDCMLLAVFVVAADFAVAAVLAVATVRADLAEAADRCETAVPTEARDRAVAAPLSPPAVAPDRAVVVPERAVVPPPRRDEATLADITSEQTTVVYHRRNHMCTPRGDAAGKV